jgi:ATP-binding cassette subfamily C protein
MPAMNDGKARRLLGASTTLVREMFRTSPRESVLGVVLLLLLTATEGAGLLLLAPLLELVGVVEESPLPRAGGWLETGFAAVGLQPTLEPVLILFVAIAALRTLCQRWQARLKVTVRENLVSAFRIRVYRAMAAAEWRFLVTRRPADFVHVLIGETGRIGGAASQLMDMAVAIMVSAVYLALAVRLSPATAALVLGCAALLGWIVRGSLGRARAAATLAAENRGKLHAAIAEHVGVLKLAKSYGATGRHEQIVVDLSDESRRVALAVTAGESGLQQTLELGSTILLAFIVYASTEIFNIPSALSLVLLFVFARLMPRLVAIYRHVQGLHAVLPVLDSVLTLERECAAAAETAETAGGGALTLADRIRFDNVSFSYLRRGSVEAVRALDLDIRAGLTTAIVGASGSGKSTVADLLMGLLTPASGRIVVDGEVLAADRLAAWRRQISYVPQDTFLLHDTVRANLQWAAPQAADVDIWEALRLSAADVFVAALPHGLETVVGERGVLVSGGERQRLSIARALLRRPRMLVLDEATSSLDGDNESRIQQAIDALHHRMTIVIITHRLSTIRHADVIHVMENGRLIQSGSWDDLQLDRDGRFRELSCP